MPAGQATATAAGPALLALTLSCLGLCLWARLHLGCRAPPLQGSELRDALLGRIFGYAAVARSGRAIPADLAAGMAAGLVAAAQKKSFLREAAGEEGPGGEVCPRRRRRSAACASWQPPRRGGRLDRGAAVCKAHHRLLASFDHPAAHPGCSLACAARLLLPHPALIPLIPWPSLFAPLAGTVLLELCQRCDDASLASLSAGPLAPWLTATPEDAAPEALLLALRLWPRLPPAVAAACPLLPAGFKAQQLPASLFTDPTTATGSKAAAAAAAAFFSRQHLSTLLPVLRATTQAHPRLHSVWPTLLALLIPGFSADKVRRRQTLSEASMQRGAGPRARWAPG